MFDTYFKITERSTIACRTVSNLLITEGSYLGNRDSRNPNSIHTNSAEAAIRGHRAARVLRYSNYSETGVIPTGLLLQKLSESDVAELNPISGTLRFNIALCKKVLRKGQKVVINDINLISYGTKGELLGFTFNSLGNVIAHVHYTEGAAPITISVDKIEFCKPPKIFMVQIVNNPEETSYLTAPGRPFNYHRDSGVGENKNVVLPYTFNSRNQAVQFIKGFVNSDRKEYIILETTAFVTADLELDYK